jgi:hypothetical protein
MDACVRLFCVCAVAADLKNKSYEVIQSIFFSSLPNT